MLGLLLVSTVLVQSPETSGFRIEYDEVKDLTTIVWPLGTLPLAEPAALQARLSVIAAGKGRDPATYGPPVLHFSSLSEDWEFLENDALSILADDTRANATSFEDRHDILAANRLSEQMFYNTDLDMLAKLGGAAKLTLRVGIRDFVPDANQKALMLQAVEVLRDPVNKIAEIRAKEAKWREAAKDYNEEASKIDRAATTMGRNESRSYRKRKYVEMIAKLTEKHELGEGELEQAWRMYGRN